MDVDRILAGASEPAASTRLQTWVQAVRARLSPDQLLAIDQWFHDSPFEAGGQHAFRDGRLDTAYLGLVAERIGEKHERFAERAAPIAKIFEFAEDRPVLASTLVWHVMGRTEPMLASSLLQAIRERARLPGLRKRITPREVPEKFDLSWFEDRQLEDAARWAEYIPAPNTETLAAAITAIENQRVRSGANVAELAPFLRRIASFLLTLHKHSLDPLGFEISRDARLVGDPPLSKRFEVAAWARMAGRTLCVRGQMMILSLEVAAPWPLTLEVIVSELGRGISGAFGIVMRLRGDHVPPLSPVATPVLLCVPGESIDERGARFERWSQRAYPHAVEAWRVVA